MTPLEKQAEHYAHNHFEMHENHYKGLKQGFIAGVESDFAKLELMRAELYILESPVYVDPAARKIAAKTVREQIKKLEDANKI
jgi:hypothetical protein